MSSSKISQSEESVGRFLRTLRGRDGAGGAPPQQSPPSQAVSAVALALVWRWCIFFNLLLLVSIR